jgi:LmbE family N-acetylglucosaminyl deacetylase
MKQAMGDFPEDFLRTASALVVIAPHPDDDVLGCGALIARASRHLPVRVIYLTDGAASHKNSRTYPPARLRAVREGEARNALCRLGVKTPPQFLRWPDGTLPAAGDAAAAPLLGALRSAIPDYADVVVATPWRRDPHCDHRSATSLADAVLAERPRALCIEYAVWLGVIGDASDEPLPHEGITIEVASGPWLPAKRAALSEHHSQLGGLITDASWAFEFPQELLLRALGPFERFVIPAAARS